MRITLKSITVYYRKWLKVMPEKGYKSITVKEEVYDFLMGEYRKTKNELLIKNGINSFTGYIAYRLSQLIDLPPLPQPQFRMLNHDEKGVKVWDSKLPPSGRVADVQFTPKGIYCAICDASYCEHVRFALGQPDIQKIVMQKKKEGWKLPDV